MKKEMWTNIVTNIIVAISVSIFAVGVVLAVNYCNSTEIVTLTSGESYTRSASSVEAAVLETVDTHGNQSKTNIYNPKNGFVVNVDTMNFSDREVCPCFSTKKSNEQMIYNTSSSEIVEAKVVLKQRFGHTIELLMVQ